MSTAYDSHSSPWPSHPPTRTETQASEQDSASLRRWGKGKGLTQCLSHSRLVHTSYLSSWMLASWSPVSSGRSVPGPAGGLMATKLPGGSPWAGPGGISQRDSYEWPSERCRGVGCPLCLGSVHGCPAAQAGGRSTEHVDRPQTGPCLQAEPPSENYMSSSSETAGQAQAVQTQAGLLGEGGRQRLREAAGRRSRVAGQEGGVGCTREQGQRGGHLEIGGRTSPTFPASTSSSVSSPSASSCAVWVPARPLHCVHQKMATTHVVR